MPSPHKKPTHLSRRLANFFGAIGYLFVTFEWIWLVLFFLPFFVENDQFKQLFLPAKSVPQPQQVAPALAGEPSWLAIGVMAVIVAVVIIATIAVIIFLPRTIARSGHKAISRTAGAAVPLITHHKKLSAKKTRLLTARVVVWLKLAALVLPIIGLIGIFFVPEGELSREVFMFIAAVIALLALVCFALQYLVARWRGVPSDTLL